MTTEQPVPVAAWRTWPAVVWVCSVCLLVLVPLLAPGYVLSYDMVFTPRQDLLPAALGLGGGLPRAVPQDAVVAILTSVVPGWLVQKVALSAALLGAGLGVVRLLRGRPWWVPALGGTLYVWNAWVAERLVLGHWGLLVAYAVLPWALAAAIDARRGRRGAVRLVLLCALAGLTPSGGLLVALVAVPVAVGPRSLLASAQRWLLAAGVVLVNAPWWLPSVLHPTSGISDPDGATVFALRPEGPWGVLATGLGLGGVWNAEVVPASRGWWVAPLFALVVTGFAVAGRRALRLILGTAASTWLAAVSLLGLGLGVASGWGPTRPAVAWLVGAVPGFGLLRDAQKWLAPLALLLALAGALGVARALARLRDPGVRGALVGLVLVAPLLVLPDLAWGAAGRLGPATYPPEWQTVRDRLIGQPGTGDVAVLPWAAFRAFDWNARRTLLDPAPRWLPVSSVVDDSLVVRRGDALVDVSGEDPRAAVVSAALAEGRPLVTVLPDLGIGWVLVEEAQPPGVPVGALAGLRRDVAQGGLSLWRVPEPLGPMPTPWYAPLVIVVDGGVGLLVLGLVVVVALRIVPRRIVTRR